MDPILSARGLSKTFRGIKALDDVDLTISRGTIHAIIGPNGAGKTTCFSLLTKFLSPTKGTITFNGQDITRTAPADVACLGLVRSFQISAVFSQLTVLENVRVALQRKRGENYAFWRSDRVLKSLDAPARDLLDQVGLADHSKHRACELSYGRKRALELATTLALEPELLLLDEPMAGMAIEEIDRTADLIRRSARNRTVLMVEHNLSVVAALSDTITVLARGRVLAEGPYAVVSRDERVIASYIGVAHG